MKFSKILLPIIACTFPNHSFANDLNINLFSKSCSLINNIYTKCDFKNTNIYPYSKKQLEEFIYKVNYSFERCNFNELNLEFFSEKDRFKLNLGKKSIEITGQSLNLRDSYFWDTNTNEYDSSCSLKINSVSVSFSNFTKNKIKNNLNLIKEHNKFFEDLKGLDYSLGKLKLNLNSLDKLNFSTQIQMVKLEIEEAKKINSDDLLLSYVLEDLSYELEYFESSNPSTISPGELQKVKTDSIKLIDETLKSLDNKNLKNNIQESKNNVLNILKIAEEIPNFNQDEIKAYKNELNSL